MVTVFSEGWVHRWFLSRRLRRCARRAPEEGNYGELFLG